MKTFYILLSCFLFGLCLDTTLAQTNDMNHMQEKQWNARWITIPDEPTSNYGVYHFRKVMTIPYVPDHFIVHVSADQRYILYVNGKQASKGPARCNLLHWVYETVDLSPYLQQGENVIAATVWNYGKWSPGAQISLYTAFILQGDNDQEEIANSNASWKVLKNPAYSPSLDFIQDVGPGDKIQGNLYPWGWNINGYDDTTWKHAEEREPGQPYGTGTQYLRALVPRSIPAMEEKAEAPLTLRRCTNLPLKNYFQEGKPILIGSNTHAILLFDQGYLTNSYPCWNVSKGTDSFMKVTYAESLYEDEENKGNRNEIEGKFIKGFVDYFYFDGKDNREYGPLWFRTYRYIEVDIQTGNEPLIINSFTGTFTGYPFKKNASFTCNQKIINDIWETGWRTARLCAGETYYDCPYYEQLQYGGDTRIQALISLYVSGDDRLMRKAIADLADSRTPCGLLYSRYPSKFIQIIPPFSLCWINMLHDYFMLRSDSTFIASYIPVMEGILKWYTNKIDKESGILGAMPHWNFVDWPPEWPWCDSSPTGGVPPGGISGGSSILSLQLAYTLSDAVDLLQYCNEKELAGKYALIKKKICESVMTHCYHQEKGLIADDTRYTSFSQHATIMGILVDAVSKEKAKEMMTKILSDSTLIQATVYYRFFLFMAMKKCGMGNLYIDNLCVWNNMLENGLTTFAEKPEPSRSDCHAWSASPTYDLLSTVCGIEPASPGFKSVKIQPHPGKLTYLKGKIPHPGGFISLELKMNKGKLTGIISLPDKINGCFIYQGKEISLHPGHNEVK